LYFNGSNQPKNPLYRFYQIFPSQHSAQIKRIQQTADLNRYLKQGEEESEAKETERKTEGKGT